MVWFSVGRFDLLRFVRRLVVALLSGIIGGSGDLGGNICPALTGMDLERLEITVADFPLCFFSDVHGDVDVLRHLFANEQNRCRNFFVLEISSTTGEHKLCLNRRVFAWQI